MTSNRIVTVLADDEPPSLRMLKRAVSTHENVKIAATCTTGVAVLDAINRIQPDLVFLDIQMPGLNGLEVLEKIEIPAAPMIVFVTAFNEFAIRAFKVNALDYILKPYDQDRIDESVKRAARQLALERKQPKQPSKAYLFQGEDTGTEALNRLLIKRGNRIVVLKTDEIDWIAAAGDYIEIHTKGAMHLMHEKIGEMEMKLNRRQFQRIHRSTIINVERVVELEPLFHQDHAVILRDGHRLTLSRTYHESFFRSISKIPERQRAE